MDIIVTVSAVVKVVNSRKPVRHDFRVLNKETYSTILLGRDFMRKVGEVSFNVKDNAVKIHNVWVKGVQIKSKPTVRLVSEIEIPARSECIVTGKCESKTALVVADFEPCKVKGVTGVYISKARVQPNLDGEICVSILNVNPNKVKLSNRTRIGRVITADKILEVRPRDKISTYSINSMEIQYGPNIHSNEKRQMDELIESYSDIFC